MKRAEHETDPGCNEFDFHLSIILVEIWRKHIKRVEIQKGRILLETKQKKKDLK